jgi:hypothetical protein
MSARCIRWMSSAFAGLVVMMTGGVAFAASGLMDGDRGTASAGSVELTAILGSSDLFPGSAGGDIHLAVVNSSDTALHFDSAQAGEVVSSDPRNCPSSYVTMQAAPTLHLLAAAHSTTPTTLVDVVAMLRSAPDGCQGVSFTVNLTLQNAAPISPGA